MDYTLDFNKQLWLKALATPGPIPSEEAKLVLVVRDDLGMSVGKIAAQCCHGAVSATIESYDKKPRELLHWIKTGEKKVTVKVHSLDELKAVKERADAAGLVSVLIKDAGRTEIEPGSTTVLAVGPDMSSRFAGVTDKLRLLYVYSRWSM